MGVEQTGLIRQPERLLMTDCGIAWAQTPDGSAGQRVLDATIIHDTRGQDSFGVAGRALEDNIPYQEILMGKASEVLDPEKNTDIWVPPKSFVAVSQTRYTTSSGISRQNAQPMYVQNNGHEIQFVHNGNFFKTPWADGVTIPFPGDSDSAKAAAYLMHERSYQKSWKNAMNASIQQMQKTGAYNFALTTERGEVIAVKDTTGTRPFCYGFGENRAIGGASESFALERMGLEYARELKRAEILFVERNGKTHSEFAGTPMMAAECIFEMLYFTRCQSTWGEIQIGQARDRIGAVNMQRALDKGIRPDVLMPVMGSGKHSADGARQVVNLPIIPLNKLTAKRTFIMPGQEERTAAAKKSYYVNEGDKPVLEGKAVYKMDDSIVRGTTEPMTVGVARNAGVSRIDDGITSPPVVETCDKGVNIASKDELIAASWAGQDLDVIERKVAELVGADTVTYTPLEDTIRAIDPEKTEHDFCTQCFGGEDPHGENREQFRQKERPITGKPRMEIWGSGSGTNFHRVMREVEAGRIDAEISHVVVDRTDKKTGGDVLMRRSAIGHGIETSLIDSTGRLKDPSKRAELMEEFKSHLKRTQPDLVVLGGLMTILGDDVLEVAQELEVTFLNLHPALLKKDGSTTVHTSQGEIPIFRGAHAIEDAYKNEDIPVSGVTVHQLLPGNGVDTGPIILKEEVVKRVDESQDDFEGRIHQAEYRTLPTAINRVLHPMKHNVDVSRGDYPW